jgi:prolyl 4-hydroxylase
MTHGGLKNRMATVFWYITNVEGGGHTSFPLAQGKFITELTPTTTCPYQLGVKPEAGKVIIFYSLRPDGSGDDLSQHAACPVTSGTKWAANKWVWNMPQRGLGEDD